jgi:hypothetical protein
MPATLVQSLAGTFAHQQQQCQQQQLLPSTHTVGSDNSCWPDMYLGCDCELAVGSLWWVRAHRPVTITAGCHAAVQLRYGFKRLNEYVW